VVRINPPSIRYNAGQAKFMPAYYYLRKMAQVGSIVFNQDHSFLLVMKTIKIMYWNYNSKWVTIMIRSVVMEDEKSDVFRSRFRILGKQYSNKLPDVSSRAASQPTVEIPRDNPKAPGQVKEYTSIIIGWILRGGVILSATIILIGFLLLLLQPGGIAGVSTSLGSFPHTLGQVWLGLLMLRPQAIIALGLVLLIAIPVITVITSIVAFAIERDRRFVAIAGIVLVILITSLLIGRGGG
jgi:uncharacterized membrane protein